MVCIPISTMCSSLTIAREACALRQDLDTLPRSDLTEVGEKGALALESGGISFANALTTQELLYASLIYGSVADG
jgi:hypothetical protein